MLLIAFLSAATGTDPALIAKADELNARCVDCLFAVSRDAQAQAIEEGQFPALLATSCEAERRRLHEVFVAVRIQRGSTPTQAEAEWANLETEGRASVERAFRIGHTPSQ